MEEVLRIPVCFKKTRFEKELGKLLREYLELKGIKVEVFAEGDREKFDIFIFRGKVPYLIVLEKLEEFKNFVIGDKGRVLGEKITNNCIEIYFDMTSNYKFNDGFKKMNLTPYQLIVGYDENFYPIIADMSVTAHMGVVGLSLNGKSKCIEMMLSNLIGADMVVLNAMEKDFNNLPARRINNIKEITSFLEDIAEKKEYRERPLYIIIDEWNVLSNTKGLDKTIQDLLAQARHYNVFLICIMQIGNKEDCKFKNLFNVRLAFRTLDDSTLKAFLGTNSVSGDIMKPREFYIVHSKLQKGKTYTMQQ